MWGLEPWQQCENFFGITALQFVASPTHQLYGRAPGSMVWLMVTSSEHSCQRAVPPKTDAASSPLPVAGRCRPTSPQADQAQSLVAVSITSPGSWCTQAVFSFVFLCGFFFVVVCLFVCFASQESLVGMVFDFNMIASLLQLLFWTWGIFFLVGSSILLSTVVQQLVAILVFL